MSKIVAFAPWREIAFIVFKLISPLPVLRFLHALAVQIYYTPKPQRKPEFGKGAIHFYYRDTTSI
jgi:hypothetical protein